MYVGLDVHKRACYGTLTDMVESPTFIVIVYLKIMLYEDFE